MSLCKATQREVSHGSMDPGYGGCQKYFVVLAQVTVPSPPGKGAFNGPAPRQELEVGAGFRGLDDFQVPEQGRLHPVPEHGAGVVGICPDDAGAERARSRVRASSEPWGVHGQVALASFHLLVRTVAAGPPFSVASTDCLSRIAAQGLDWRPRARRTWGLQVIMDRLPDALLPPHPEIVVHPTPGRHVVGQHPPGTTGAQHMADAERHGGQSARLGSWVDWTRRFGHRTAIARHAQAVGPRPWWGDPTVDCRDCVCPSGHQVQSPWGPSASIARWQSAGSGSTVLAPLRHLPWRYPELYSQPLVAYSDIKS